MGCRARRAPHSATGYRAYGVTVRALAAAITICNEQITAREGPVDACLGMHPNAEIYLSQPGLGPVLGARVLAEFGDDPTRFCWRTFPYELRGTSPITWASGKKRVVLARYVPTSDWPMPCTSRNSAH
jgi:transposase